MGGQIFGFFFLHFFKMCGHLDSVPTTLAAVGPSAGGQPPRHGSAKAGPWCREAIPTAHGAFSEEYAPFFTACTPGLLSPHACQCRRQVHRLDNPSQHAIIPRADETCRVAPFDHVSPDKGGGTRYSERKATLEADGPMKMSSPGAAGHAPGSFLRIGLFPHSPRVLLSGAPAPATQGA